MIALSHEVQSMLDRLLHIPTPERIAVAMTLWESIDMKDKPVQPDEDEDEFLAELMRRDAEMEAGVNVMTREAFMAAVHEERSCRSASTPAQSEK